VPLAPQTRVGALSPTFGTPAQCEAFGPSGTHAIAIGRRVYLEVLLTPNEAGFRWLRAGNTDPRVPVLPDALAHVCRVVPAHAVSVPRTSEIKTPWLLGAADSSKA